MRLRFAHRTGWQSLLLLTSIINSLPSCLAKKDGPGIKVTQVPHLPFNLQYFEGSDVVLYEDEIESNVYYSEDAGETWETARGVPPGKMLELSMHPFDNQRAYIITPEATHWKTEDRGKTWTGFFTDAEPTLFREALVYHAGDPDRILFNAMDCAGIFCEELVGHAGVNTKEEPMLTQLLDDVYYGWVFHRCEVFERRHDWVSLGEIIRALYDRSRRS